MFCYREYGKDVGAVEIVKRGDFDEDVVNVLVVRICGVKQLPKGAFLRGVAGQAIPNVEVFLDLFIGRCRDFDFLLFHILLSV